MRSSRWFVDGGPLSSSSGWRWSSGRGAAIRRSEGRMPKSRRRVAAWLAAAAHGVAHPLSPRPTTPNLVVTRARPNVSHRFVADPPSSIPMRVPVRGAGRVLTGAARHQPIRSTWRTARVLKPSRRAFHVCIMVEGSFGRYTRGQAGRDRRGADTDARCRPRGGGGCSRSRSVCPPPRDDHAQLDAACDLRRLYAVSSTGRETR